MTAYELRAYPGGAADTQLASGINATSLTFTVTTGTGVNYPDTGPYFVVIDYDRSIGEKIRVASRSGDVFTIASTGDRGVDGTTAGSHVAGAKVRACWTATDAQEANRAAHYTVGLVTSKGDLLAGTGAAALARVPVGGDGSLLVGDATQTAGLRWAAALPIVNVKDYAATGDGVADDLGAIQSAVDYAATLTNGALVYLPPGTYMVSGAITADHDGIVLAGAGIGVTTVTTTSTTADVFTFGNGTTVRSWCGVKNMRINSTVTRTAGSAVNFNAIRTSYIDDVELRTQFIGITLQGATTGVYIRRGLWADFTATTGIGLYINGGNDQYVSGIVMNTTGTQPKAGIEVVSSDGSVVITDCDFVHSGTGLLVDPGNGQTVEWMFVENSAFDFCSGRGISLAPTGTGVVKGSTFTGCWTSSCTLQGARTGATGGTVKGIRFVGHRSFGNGSAGLSIASGSTDVRVSSGDFGGNSSPSNGGVSGSTHGIYIAPGVTDFSVTDCRCGPTAGQNNTQSYGIFVDAGASDGYTILGNDCRGNVTGSVKDFGSGTTKKIASNLGFNPAGPQTAPAVPATTVALINPFGMDCMVVVAGGTVTGIAVGGTATGLTSGAVTVPAGQTITLTYTVAPTWKWFAS